MLLFIKCVSDKYAGQPYAPITIPPGAGFKDMAALKGKSDIGDQINKKIIAPLGAGTRASGGRSALSGRDRTVWSGAQRLWLRDNVGGQGYLRLIRRLRETGWRVELIYLALPNPETAKLRVAERVRHGGHDIPVADIERRFLRSWENLIGVYASIVDRTVCSLNSGESPETVFTQQGRARRGTTGDHEIDGESETEMTQVDDHEARILNVLKRAVDEALECKRRLGQYYVVWRDGRAVCIGPDAPEAPGKDE